MQGWLTWICFIGTARFIFGWHLGKEAQIWPGMKGQVQDFCLTNALFGGPEDSCVICLENNHLHDLLLIAHGGMYLRGEIMSSWQWDKELFESFWRVCEEKFVGCTRKGTLVSRMQSCILILPSFGAVFLLWIEGCSSSCCCCHLRACKIVRLCHDYKASDLMFIRCLFSGLSVVK